MLSAVIHFTTHGDVTGKGDDSKETHPTEGDDSKQIHPTDISSMLWPKSFWHVMKAFPIIISAFSCQVNVCEIYERLSPDDAQNLSSRGMSELKSNQCIMACITRNDVAFCMTLYICIGLFGFLDCLHDTVDNILNNYCIQNTRDALMVAASAFVTVAVVVAFHLTSYL